MIFFLKVQIIVRERKPWILLHLIFTDMKHLCLALICIISYQFNAQNVECKKAITQTQSDSDTISTKNGIIQGHVPLLKGIPIHKVTSKKRLDNIRLNFKKSKLIKLIDESEDFESLPQFQRMRMGHLSPTIKSSNQDFIAFFSIQPNNSQPPFILKDKVEYEGKEIPRYLLHIRANLAISLNKNISFDEIEHFIEYKPATYAKDIFNADTVITYSLSLGGEYLRGKYKHCDVWLFHKINVGYFSLYCFYTDKGYANKRMYEQELEKILRFKD